MDIKDGVDLIELVRTARGGSSQAYGCLVSRTRLAVAAAIRRVVRDRHDAEDLVQETFVRAFGLLPQLRDPAAVVGWLQRIGRSVALNHLRRQRWSFVQQGEATLLPAAERTAPADAESADEALARALLRLSPDERRLCDRYYHGRWTTARLAGELCVSEAAVRKRLQRVRDHLREEMTMGLPDDLPDQIVRLLSRPDLTGMPDNPVGAVWRAFRGHFPEFTEVSLPERIDRDQARDLMGGTGAPDAPLDEYLQSIARQHGLRRDLTLPMLTTAARQPGCRQAIAAGKTYRLDDGEEGPTRLQAFHQAEVLWLAEALDEWQMMGRIASSIDDLTGGARLRVLQVAFPLYGDRGWEVAVQWPGDDWSSVCGWCRLKGDLVTRLGHDASCGAAVGIGIGLERIACLRYSVDDVRKLAAMTV